ncbi:hypothetical protein D3C72_1981550 [compost metagenome]
MLLAQRAEAFFGRRFVGHTLKRRDIERIDGFQRLRRAPLADVVFFLLPGPGAPPFLARVFQPGSCGLLLQITLAAIVAVVAAVAVQCARRQFDNALHTRQQLPIVAGHQ